MTIDFQSILKILQPPANPNGLDRSWDTVEKEIGLDLPSDYKAFIDRFGTGVIDDAISIWNFRDDEVFNRPVPEILCGAGGVIPLYKQVESMGCELPYKLYPQSGGLLPFGVVNDVHHLNWLTVGAPTNWDIVYWYSDGLEFIHYAGDNFCQFLVKCLSESYSDYQLPKLVAPFEFLPK